MPIFEYKCPACEVVIERYQKLNAELPLPYCEICLIKTVHIFPTGGSFDLRGTGFYKNDYGNGAHKLDNLSQHRRMLREMDERGITPAPRATDL